MLCIAVRNRVEEVNIAKWKQTSHHSPTDKDVSNSEEVHQLLFEKATTTQECLSSAVMQSLMI